MTNPEHPTDDQLDAFIAALIRDDTVPEGIDPDQWTPDANARFVRRLSEYVKQYEQLLDAMEAQRATEAFALTGNIADSLDARLGAHGIDAEDRAEGSRRYREWLTAIIDAGDLRNVTEAETVARRIVPELHTYGGLNIAAGPKHWLDLWAKNQAHEAAEQLGAPNGA